MRWIRNKYETLKRMWFWAWKMRKSYDFDAYTIYDMLYHKLDRVYWCMRNDSHCVWNSDPSHKGMKKLYEARGLAKKLSDSCRYSRHYSRLTDKYYDKDDNGVMSKWRKELHPNAKPMDQKLYSFMVRKSFNKDNEEYKRDKERLFSLLEKHIAGWWD